MNTYDIDLAINYCTFENFKQKSAYILNALFANGRIIDYAKFSCFGNITPLNDKNNKIHVEELDKFNRTKVNCLIYDLTYNKYNDGKYDKLFIYYSTVVRDTNWYGYVFYNTQTGKTLHKYCIEYADDKLYQYIYKSILFLSEDKLWNHYSEKFDALRAHDKKGIKTIKDWREMHQYYEELPKKPFDPNFKYINY